MAEFINEIQETMLPEYEQMKEFSVCSDDQLRDCIRKREAFITKITQSEKTIKDYADFIIFEKKVHKWITEKERIFGSLLAGLKASVFSRIVRLYREGVRQFAEEVRFWENYIKFSKKVLAHEVSGIYEKMLTFHADKPSVWCDAALWAYGYSVDIARVKDIFMRALQKHPESEAINKTFFDIMLLEASKMSTQKNPAKNEPSRQEIGLERAEVIYRNSKKRISNISYFLCLLERCEEDLFKNMTARLQKVILDDLMLMFPREETLWDAIAQRELRGFSMNDLRHIRSQRCLYNPFTSELNANLTVGDSTITTGPSPDNVLTIDLASDDADDAIIYGRSIWQRRTLKQRIELCCRVYQMALRSLRTPLICTLYINAMLKLNQDMSTQRTEKRRRLASAFKIGHESGLMCVDHYSIFIHLLTQGADGLSVADTVLSEAVKRHRSSKLYELWICMYIMDNDEPKIYRIFRKAVQELGHESFPIWRIALQFYKTRFGDCGQRLRRLYKEACTQMSPDFGIFRAQYLDFCVINMSMKKLRNEYDMMCHQPPPCLELHQKMAKIESYNIIATSYDLQRWRLCHENSVYYFGRTSSKVWIDYIKFERDHGEPKHITALYNRAKELMDYKLVEGFVSEYTLLTAMV